MVKASSPARHLIMNGRQNLPPNLSPLAALQAAICRFTSSQGIAALSPGLDSFGPLGQRQTHPFSPQFRMSEAYFRLKFMIYGAFWCISVQLNSSRSRFMKSPYSLLVTDLKRCTLLDSNQ
jgi:hypothetical protein